MPNAFGAEEAVSEGVRIRPATVADAPAMAAVHVETWRTAYAHIFPAQFLEALSVEHRRGVWERVLAGLPEDEHAHVAELRREVVGFAHCGPSRDDDGRGVAELSAVYVAGHCWSLGVGRALIASARGVLVDRGWTEATLWVLERNLRARSFYEHDGWVEDGATQPIERGGVTVLELRYRTALVR